MKLKNGKKLMAAILSAAMVAGMSMSAFAAETPDQGQITAPILSFDVVDVVVPSHYAMVFNPEGRNVKVDDSTVSQDQILARNYGILNKSSKDKVVTVELNVNSQNNGQITFVDDEASVSDNAIPGDYKIYLAAIPADDVKEVKVNSAPATDVTDGEALSKAEMDKADAMKVTMKEGSNTLAFKLEKAKWDVDTSKPIILDSVSSNNIKDNMKITGVADDGKGITAFTFGGKMNANAEWQKLEEQIKITATYDIKTATGDEEAVTGTGAMVKAGASIALSGTYSRANTANTFILSNLGSATVTKVEALNSEGEVFADITTSMYKVEGDSLKVDGSKAPWGAGAAGQSRGIKVTLSTGKTIQTTFTVNK